MKNASRKLAAVAAGVGIAPVVAVIPATSAFAHGYISAPMSRQAQCAKGIVQCGAVKYEPQSVEAPKGGRTCSGGSRFRDLDDNSKAWKVTDVGQTMNVTWTFTARHRTTNYEYFIGGRKIASVSGNNQQPPSTISHPVSLAGFSGRQTVLAVWNIADTGNAFYACLDVNVR
ncbi:chitin-binding protein [Actinomadura pelletieri DSM 43383]|uniref:Chitin-binding protein n=1 Tax=Actinomadura pelletieri DSM 43383 TaxID=1120940 RepID=A0A495QXN9_9ACTN|nr:lytic polysaccharide monooxygenase auxiliary activity family 9 protein [Actinomadura pelletieri]RKS78951.1 chitin-binding protein [Actinomadura pelletieri DSM 43383]